MSRRFVQTLVAGAVLAVGLQAVGLAQDVKRTIAITQYVEHPELDKVRKGALEALAEAGFTKDNARIVFESAQADIATAVQIASRFSEMKPDVIIAISTPSAQTIVRSGIKVPIVFGAISDPVKAGLVSNLEKPGANVTGTSARPRVEPQIELIKRLTPNVKRIGVLANPSEVNSKVVVDDFVEQGTRAGYQIRVEAVTSSAEVPAAAGNLVDVVDAIFIPTDNTVVSGLEGAVNLAIARRLPLYTADTNGVNRGAMAAIGYDYHQVGRDTGAMAARILKGEKPADIPVISASKTSLLFNLKTAKQIGVSIPQDLLASAGAVVQ